jgi:hypothetical protein
MGRRDIESAAGVILAMAIGVLGTLVLVHWATCPGVC